MDNLSPDPPSEISRIDFTTLTREQKYDIVSAIYNRPQDLHLTPSVALAHGISLSTYHRWRLQFNREAAPGGEPFPLKQNRPAPRRIVTGLRNTAQRIAALKSIHALHQAGMTIYEACHEHNIHPVTYLRWRKTLRDAPGLELSETDVLTKKKDRVMTPPDERAKAIEKVMKLMKEEGITRRAACARLDYHYSAMTMWIKRLGYDGLGKRHTDGDKTPRPTKRDVNNLFIAPKIPAGLEMLQRVDATIANGMTREEACDKHGISLMFYERLETMFRPK